MLPERDPRPPGFYYDDPLLVESVVPGGVLQSAIPAILSGTNQAAGGDSGGPIHANLFVWMVAVPGARIFYTTDGTDPNARSPVYGRPIKVSSTVTFRALSVEPGKSFSRISTATYFLPQTLPAPSILPAGGDAEAVASVEISVPGHPAALIFYTVDGSIPNQSSPAWPGPIALTSDGVRVTAVAFEAGWLQSPPASVYYQPSFLPSPVISGVRQSNPNLIELHLSLPPEYDDAFIFFTVDGSDPSPANYAGVRPVSSGGQCHSNCGCYGGW